MTLTAIIHTLQTARARHCLAHGMTPDAAAEEAYLCGKAYEALFLWRRDLGGNR